MSMPATGITQSERALDTRTMLYCVGAQKAGTSWLHTYLNNHPDVHVPKRKEMHYFDNLYGPEKGGPARRTQARLASGMDKPGVLDVVTAFNSDVLNFPSRAYTEAIADMYSDTDPEHSAYVRLLTNGIESQSCIADITPAYALVGETGFREMYRIAPGARFVFVMRDPVDRTWSSIRMACEHRIRNGEGNPETLHLNKAEEFLSGDARHIRQRSTYSQTITALEAAVPAEQIMYLFYETMFDPAQLRRLTDFIGVLPENADLDTFVRKGNEHDLPDDLRARLRISLDEEYAALTARFGKSLPDEWMTQEPDLTGNDEVAK